MRFIDFCMADPESVKSMSESILKYLGEPSTKLQRTALKAYQAGDSTRLAQSLSLDLSDPYLKCLHYLNSAARSSDPPTAGEAIDKAIEVLGNWDNQDKETSYRKPDSLTESIEKIFRTMLEN